MLSTILTEVKGLVDKRFLLISFFPMLVAVAVGTLLVASGSSGVDDWIERWGTYAGVKQAVILAGALSVVLVLATILSTTSIVLIRLYEGYYGPEWQKKVGVNTQEGRKADVSLDPEAQVLFPNSNVMPTTLGNILRSAEEYPLRAFGAASDVVWPRLFQVLPAEFITSMTGPADAVSFLLNVSFLAITVGLAGGIYAVIEGLGSVAYTSTVLGGGAIAYFTYRAATEAAIDYGLHIRAAFDLHRHDLLMKLHRTAPVTQAEELRLWKDVSDRLRYGEPAPVRYSVEGDE